jgi:hypothetical protein
VLVAEVELGAATELAVLGPRDAFTPLQATSIAEDATALLSKLKLMLALPIVEATRPATRDTAGGSPTRSREVDRNPTESPT